MFGDILSTVHRLVGDDGFENMVADQGGMDERIEPEGTAAGRHQDCPNDHEVRRNGQCCFDRREPRQAR